MSILDELSDEEKQALAQEYLEKTGIPDPTFDDGEEESTETRSAVARNAASGRPKAANPYSEAEHDFDADLAAGDTRDKALAKYISKINYAAMSGDPRVASQVDAREYVGSKDPNAHRSPNPSYRSRD